MASKLIQQSQSGTIMQRLVTELVEELTNSTPKDQEATLSTLKTIFDNIIQHPNDDKYCQIKLSDKPFSCKVWCFPAAVNVMKMSGWEEDGDCVRLRYGSDFKAISELLEQELQKLRVPTPEDVNTGTSSLSQCCVLTKDAAAKIIGAIDAEMANT